MFQLIFGIGFIIMTTSLKYEVPIDMNNKNITGVRKIETFSMSVDNHIDMKNHKIINLDDGGVSGDVINKRQLDAVQNQVDTINTNVNTINTNNGYYYFIKQLNHNNNSYVHFPSNIDKYPFKSANDPIYGGVLRISLSGYYHIIYTDYYKIKVTSNASFIIWDLSNGKVLFSTTFNHKTDFTPITINAVINIQANATIGLHLTPANAILDGGEYSTFFIKYLGN